MSTDKHSHLSEDVRSLFKQSKPLNQDELNQLAGAAAKLDDDPAFRADYLKGLFLEQIHEAIQEGNHSQSELAALVGRRLELVVLNPDEHTHVLRCKVPVRKEGRIRSKGASQQTAGIDFAQAVVFHNREAPRNSGVASKGENPQDFPFPAF